MGSPRLVIVFRRWECDKENHGWREGPPLSLAWKRFDLLAGPSPSGKISSNEKRILLSIPHARRRQLGTLAGIKGHIGRKVALAFRKHTSR